MWVTRGANVAQLEIPQLHVRMSYNLQQHDLQVTRNIEATVTYVL